MATDNKQKVLIRSMSYEELENYLINSDLNGKIVPQNENTWHQNYSDITSSSLFFASILTNDSSTNYYTYFLKRKIINTNFNSLRYLKNKILSNTITTPNANCISINAFRPLIEYKE